MDISIPTWIALLLNYRLIPPSSLFYQWQGCLCITLPFPYFCASFRITFLLSFSILHLYLRRNTYDEITRGTYLCNISQTLTLAYLNKFPRHGTILKKSPIFYVRDIVAFPFRQFYLLYYAIPYEAKIISRVFKRTNFPSDINWFTFFLFSEYDFEIYEAPVTHIAIGSRSISRIVISYSEIFISNSRYSSLGL